MRWVECGTLCADALVREFDVIKRVIRTKNRVAWLWEIEGELLGGHARFSVVVGIENAWLFVEPIVRGSAASDLEGSAVHVHLPVADLVEPGPR